MTYNFSKQTCADCMYHVCSNICTSKKRCNGECNIIKNEKVCYKSACKDYKFDSFFLNIENFYKEE